ncbi:MAG: NAD-dependent epimerase/dehydratase family protein [Candidatus Omnitrophica bacterium]|nr:NAD-dependent epimerase/dehydratase family protein [Candidatus Omnitrophota bacterium]
MKEEILSSFSGKNVLVTGGTGLIGRQVVDILVGSGACVVIISLDELKVNNCVEHIIGDLTDFSFCKKVIRDFDFVFHLAGIKGSIDVTRNKPASFFVPLLMLNANVLEACRISNVKKTVYTSSIGAYASAEVFKEEEATGPPMDMFPGWAKRMAELQVKAYQIQYGLNNFSIVRPCNVYGPGDNFDPDNAMVIPSLMSKIYNKCDPVMVWGDGSAIRDFAYSRDVAEGVILALYHGTKSGFVNLGSGKGYSIKELVQALASFLDFNYEFDVSKKGGFPKRVMDISLAQKLIGYQPSTSLLDGLKQTWEWFVKNQDEYKFKKNYFKDD